MKAIIPTAAAVQAFLAKLRSDQFAEVIRQSGVPRRTAYNIRTGTTPNPGIDTARALYLAAEKVRRRQPAEPAESAS